MSDKWFERMLAMAVVIMLIALALSCVKMAVSLSANKFCLERGFAGSRIDYTFTGYCIKREDQTDVVIPIAALKRGPSK